MNVHAATLPPEVLDQVFGLAVETLLPSESTSNFAAFSLVAKGWTGVAQRRMLRTVVVKGGRMTRLLVARARRADVGRAVRSVTVIFQDTTPDAWYPIPNAKGIQRDDMASLDDLVSLLKQTSRITHLSLELPTFVRFRRRDTPDLAAVFANLESLHLDTMFYDTEQEVLRAILTEAPSLQSLSLCNGARAPYGPYPSEIPTPSPLAVFPASLRSLSVAGRFFHLWLFHQESPILPSQAYESLEEMVVEGYLFINSRHTARLLETMGPTLRTLNIGGPSISAVQRTFSHLPALTNLLGFADFYTPALDSLPSTVRVLEAHSTSLLIHWFETQSITPSAPFNVRELRIRRLHDLSLLSSLPSSVQIVSLLDHEMPVEYLQRFVVDGRPSFKTLETPRPAIATGRDSYESQRDLQAACDEAGIELRWTVS